MGLAVDHYGTGEWAFLEAHRSGCASAPIGILLRDVDRDQLYVRLRPEWWSLLPDQNEEEFWRGLAEDLEQKAREIGAVRVLEWLESTASHSIQISTRQNIQLTTAQATLHGLYQQHLEDSQGCSEVHRQRFSHRPAASQGNWKARISSRKQQRVYDRWWVQAALAAALLLTATLAGMQSHRTIPSRVLVRTETQAYGELPLFTGAPDHPVLWNIDSDGQASRPGRHRKTRAVLSPTRKRFWMDCTLVRPRAVPFARLDPPLLKIEPEVTPAAWWPTPPQPLPLPERYRTRHHKFVRVLAIVVAPFRKIVK